MSKTGRFRRCAHLAFEPRQRLQFDLGALGGGGSGLRAAPYWIAIAPHLCVEIELSAAEIAALGAVSPSSWTTREALDARIDSAIVDALIERRLIVEDGSEADARDLTMRDTHWRTLSAVVHFASRWQGADTEAAEQEYVATTEGSLLDRLGAAPPLARERSAANERMRLEKPDASALDALLDGRVTCRNFDARAVSLADFSALMFRVFGARAVDDFAPGVQLAKKGVPSAGGLHPTEAYVLVQRVEGVAPGFYHYHAVDHALEPLQSLSSSEAEAHAHRFVAAQRYFSRAPVIVVAAARFRRNFWKYRNHAKAYRALALDVGHLSQTLYLAATEIGLAAFITAAINEADIESALGLDPLEEGALAVMGFGHRGETRAEIEFDPCRAVWPAP